MEPPLERRVRFTLQYDGSVFQGWQTQPGARTVQSEVEGALSRLVDRPVRVVAAGRTDRGVHATGQVVSVVVPPKWSPEALRRALNALLPAEVRVTAASEAAPPFHARYSAVARGYVYRLGTHPLAHSPFRRRWCWPLAEALEQDARRGLAFDVAWLRQAAAALAGRRAFRAFAKAGQEERGDVCTVHRAAWQEWASGLQLVIVADRFLHHMVRYLVGTMVDIARGRRPGEDWVRLLDGDADVTTSPPAPPEGLFLVRVYYDTTELEAEESFDEDLP
ncbi:MAG: tRNA pseudouridine(38-40) synthase TruA [Longimicrobiales bacterium]